MSVFTAGIPAEYGRKIGGIVELNAVRDTRAPACTGRWTFPAAASTQAALPPVVQNFTNSGTTGDFAASYERDLTERDRVSVSVRHELPRFLVPNEQLQQAAGQRQDRDNFETMGMGSYQHVFSPNAVGDFSGMVRDNANDLSSNPNSTPVIAF